MVGRNQKYHFHCDSHFWLAINDICKHFDTMCGSNFRWQEKFVFQRSTTHEHKRHSSSGALLTSFTSYDPPFFLGGTEFDSMTSATELTKPAFHSHLITTRENSALSSQGNAVNKFLDIRPLIWLRCLCWYAQRLKSSFFFSAFFFFFSLPLISFLTMTI